MGKVVLKSATQMVRPAGAAQKSAYWVTRAQRYNTLSEDKVLDYIATSVGIPKNLVTRTMAAIEKSFESHLLNGHRIKVGEVGFFEPQIKTVAVSNPENVGASLVKRLRIAFLPVMAVRNKVNETSLETVIVKSESV